MARQGAALQTYNLEIVKGIEGMKMKLSELQKQINQQEDEKTTLQRDIEEKMCKLNEINASLSKKAAVRNEYDRTIAEAEAAYSKILKSAQALSDMLQKQSCYEEALVEKNVDSHSLVM